MKEALGWQLLAGMIEMTKDDGWIQIQKESEMVELKVPVIPCVSLIATWKNLWESVLSMPEGMAKAECDG